MQVQKWNWTTLQWFWRVDARVKHAKPVVWCKRGDRFVIYICKSQYKTKVARRFQYQVFRVGAVVVFENHKNAKNGIELPYSSFEGPKSYEKSSL